MSGGPYQVIASSVTATTYTDTAVTGGNTYYYVVASASNFSGMGSPSNEASAAVPAASNPAPLSPIDLTAAGGDQQVSLSWTADADVTSGDGTVYNVKRAAASGGPYTTLATQSNTTFTDTALTDGTIYFYVVTAVRNSAESPLSNETSAVPVVSAVVIQSASARNGRVDLSWTTSANAIGYNLKRATTSGGPYTPVASLDKFTSLYYDTGLTNGTTYYYVVTALNASGGCGTDSLEASATPTAPPTPPAPSNLSAMAGTGTVWLSWQGTVTGNYGSYDVERATSSGGPYTVIAPNVSTPSFKDTSVINGTTYYYVVVPVNDGVIGAVSGEASATPQDFAQDFRFQQIGQLTDAGGPAGTVARAGINDLTHVASPQFVAGDYAYTGLAKHHAFFYNPTGNLELDLGTLISDSTPDHMDSVASGINNLDQIVGVAQDDAYTYHGFLWNPTSGMQNIGTFSPYGINDNSMICGSNGHAIVYAGGLWDLGTLLPDPNNAGTFDGTATAYGINNAGLIAGISSSDPSNADNVHAFLHNGLALMTPDDDLGTLGGKSSAALAVNNFAQAVGWSQTADSATHACLWDGGAHDLGTLGGGYSVAYGINDQGQIVGEAQTANGSMHAFLYQNGSMIDLNTLLSPSNEDSPWDSLDLAAGINNHGEITGYGANTGFERMFLMKHSTPQASCPCQIPTYTRPALQNITSNWGDGRDWTMTAEVSDRDGLVLHDVKLGARYMAQEISVPYYTLKTSGFSDTQGNPVRGELTPDSNAAQERCRLVDFQVSQPGANPLVVQATYAINNISNAGAGSCLSITQRYEFYRETVGNEPSSVVAKNMHLDPLPPFKSSAFKPIIEYAFHGKNGETLTSLNVPQRCFFQDDKMTPNTSALYQDANYPYEVALGNILNPQDILNNGIEIINATKAKTKPVTETLYSVIQNGVSIPSTWDNYHQTYMDDVSDPSTLPPGPGCPECIHVHWRWTAQAPKDPYGGGKARIPVGSKQDVDVAVAKYAPGEEHPNDFHDLLNGESLDGQDEVFWYSATGHTDFDRFFTHGGFFGAFGDVPLQCDVAITQDMLPNTTVSVGDTLEFTYYVHNNGPAPAYNCVAVAQIPAGMKLVNVTCDPGPYGDPVIAAQQPDNSVDFWIGDTLDTFPDDIVTLHVFLKATAPGTVTNKAIIAPSDSHTDTDLTNNAVSQDITVQ